MRIDNSDVKVSFDFSPKTHFLVYSKDCRFSNGTDGSNKPLMVWTLNQRIDMSYKDKSDQVGIEVIYLTDREADACKKSGFSYIEENEDTVLNKNLDEAIQRYEKSKSDGTLDEKFPKI